MSSLTVLITGGAGFVGSSLAIHIKTKYPDYTVISLDNLKRRGSELNLPRLRAHGVVFIHGDIRNKEDLDAIEHADVLIESSAEPSVLAGIDSLPDYLINTNLIGTINCLNFAVKKKAKVIFLSTSRVYPIEHINTIQTIESETRFNISPNQPLAGVTIDGLTESFPTDGYRSFYGTTKLSSELLIHEYNKFYGLETVINRCGVLTGPWQMGKIDQGVVVLWVAMHFWKKSLKYIGFDGLGKQVRDILHIDDLFDLIDLQMHNFKSVNNQTFNVGGGKDISVSLLELTALCQKITGNIIPIEGVKETRQADIRLYLTDNAKITRLTGWKPSKSPAVIVEDIHTWLAENQEQLKHILT